MKNILTIIKKEFARFFKDKRMIITVLLPGLLIYVVYSLMGTAVSGLMESATDTKCTAYIVEMPADAELSAYLDFILDVKEDYRDIEEAKKAVEEGSLDLAIVFPEGFDDALNGTSEEAPDVSVYYNSTNTNSVSGYAIVNAILEEKKNPAFSVNGAMDGVFDLASEKDFSGKMLAMFMPMLMFALLVSGCVAVAPEAIAGEKERGTMATMLITPIKRWQLALGKIISLTCFALISGISSFLGVILSLPKLMESMSGGSLVAYYTVGDYFMIFGLIISALLVIISAFSILSAFAKSVKEAGTLITPLMILILVLGVVSMVVPSPAIGLFAIPLLGSELAMSAIFTFSIEPLAFLLSVISNVVLAIVFVVILSYMFSSERIMFNK